MGHAPLAASLVHSPRESAWGPWQGALDSDPLTPGLLAAGVGGELVLIPSVAHCLASPGTKVQ